MPEVNKDMIKRSNPNAFDLYQCAFGHGGELEVYADRVRTKLI